MAEEIQKRQPLPVSLLIMLSAIGIGLLMLVVKMVGF
jgi:hypothetical protein